MNITQLASALHWVSPKYAQKKNPSLNLKTVSFQAYMDNEYKYSSDLLACLSYVCWNIEDLRETFKN